MKYGKSPSSHYYMQTLQSQFESGVLHSLLFWFKMHQNDKKGYKIDKKRVPKPRIELGSQGSQP